MKANENMHLTFYCENCDYACSKKYSWNQHILTRKHINAKNGLTNANKKYACEICDATFKHQSSFCRHKKKCGNSFIVDNVISDKELIVMLVKQNTELMEILKHGTSNQNTNNSHNTNSLNKTFNLQFFLNETCKDAMNITDFVNSIKLQLSDFENIGDLGYVQGISNIITSNLKALDVTQRPVHCTDKKRETMYVKDDDKWEKEDENNTKIRNVIKSVSNKNIRLIPQFKEKYPDYNDAESTISDKYSKMVIEAMGGEGNNDTEKENKIIHNISKCITIDKTIA
jgi:hypothetical protein